MAIWSRIQALIFGGAVATAASDGARPVLEPVRQHAWQRNQLRVLDPGAAGALRAQGLINDEALHEEASRSGLNENRADALAQLAQRAPGTGEVDRMVNRETFSREDFNTAMAKHGIPPRWWDALYDLTNDKLDPVQLANAIHRGLVDDPGLLAVAPPTGSGNVPAYPVYPIDALKEAKAAGIDRSRLGVLVGLMGLPMGVHEAAQAVFRKILTKTDFDRAVAEGNTRNEWGDAIFEQSRQIPTARDFLENALRGYRDLAAAIEGAELHGMSPEHATMIYQNQGRPMAVRQITQALARGGTFNPEPGEIKDPYDASIVEGNLKPGYYELAKALRYTYPSPFVIRQLTESKAITRDEAEQVLLYEGWEPGFAAKVADAWAGSGGGTADTHVSKAQTQLWNRLHTSYLAGELDEQTALATLPEAGVSAAAAPAVIALWDTERGIVRKQLTPTQIRTALRKNVVNPATGAAWTRGDAIARLTGLGMSVNDANTFLDE